jgi:predicted hydrocarbon binding protein
MIDGEISLKSLLYVTESLEQLIGKNGAKAVLRVAGQRAAVNLIEMLPLTLPEDEAASRIGPILSELGFLESMEVLAPNTIKVSGNHIYEELATLNLQGTASACYYLIGLFEGFFKQLTGSNKKITMVETKESAEFWKLE